MSSVMGEITRSEEFNSMNGKGVSWSENSKWLHKGPIKLAFLWLLTLMCSYSYAFGYPEYQSAYVNDYAGVLDVQTELRITDKLKELRRGRGTEMTVLTVDRRSFYVQGVSLESFATGTFNKWGVGEAQRNDGILILVCVGDRDMRIELGKGYGERFDGIAKEIIDDVFIPHFKSGEYAKGIELGVAASIRRLDYSILEDKYGIKRVKYFWVNAWHRIISGGIFSWIVGGLASLLGYRGWRRYLRYRPRRCSLCGGKMQRLSEQDDDEHLNIGQRLEESLSSVDYDVWVCPADGGKTIESYSAWLSSFGSCPKCRFRTVSSTRDVLYRATETNTGKAIDRYSCQHCHHSWKETVVLPRKSKSSSSSSSGSSGSFGGGSSSGGGASGSW